MKKLFFLIAIIFGFMANANAQDTAFVSSITGFGLPVEGSSAEIQAWQEECRRTDNLTPGTCVVKVRYQSDYFPVRFIQGDKVLKEVYTGEDGAVGLELVEGVKYEVLPNGGMRYILEVRNAKGAMFLIRNIGS